MGIFDTVLRSDGKIRGGIKDKRKSDAAEARAKRAVANEEHRQEQLKVDQRRHDDERRQRDFDEDRRREQQRVDEDNRRLREDNDRDRNAEGSVSPRRESKSRKIYFSEVNAAFINEIDQPSRLANMAVIHLKTHMNKLIKDLNIKFDFNEIDAVVGVLHARVLGDCEVDCMYFESLGEARTTLKEINERTEHLQDEGWKKAYPILLKHCDLDELNCFLYLAKFKSISGKRSIDKNSVNFRRLVGSGEG